MSGRASSATSSRKRDVSRSKRLWIGRPRPPYRARAGPARSARTRSGGDAPVCAVHRAEHEEVLWQRQRAADALAEVVREVDRPVRLVRFEEMDRLTEDLGQVGAVELVDVEQIGGIRFRARLGDRLEQVPAARQKAQTEPVVRRDRRAPARR